MDEARVQQLIQQTLEAQEQRFTSIIAELRTEVTVVTKLFESLNPPSSSSTKPRLSHPDKFDGSLSAWEVWYPEMKAKLRIDRQALGEEEAQFWYIYGRLEKKVQALVAPQIAYAERVQHYETQALFDQLARLCDNPNTKRDAEDKLYSLSQFNGQGINAYLAIFERFMYKAEANNWTDDAKIALLRRQLNDKMKRRLNTQITVPTTYSDFVKVLQQLDDGASSRQAKINKAGGDPMVIGAIHKQEDSGSEGSDDSDTGEVGKLWYNSATGKYRKI